MPAFRDLTDFYSLLGFGYLLGNKNYIEMYARLKLVAFGNIYCMKMAKMLKRGEIHVMPTSKPS